MVRFSQIGDLPSIFCDCDHKFDSFVMSKNIANYRNLEENRQNLEYIESLKRAGIILIF